LADRTEEKIKVINEIYQSYLEKDIRSIARSREAGHLFENFIFNILVEKLEYSSSAINFWRTKDGAEVDFVIKSGVKTTPVEVKYKRLAKPEITRSLHSFISAYRPEEAFVVNLDYTDEMMIGKTKVRFVPYFELIAADFSL